MNKEFQYILQPYKGTSTRHTCPGCNKKNQFAKYISTETLQPLAAYVGRCNREVSCGYHYTPKQFFEDNPGFNSDIKTIIKPARKISTIQEPQQKKISLIPFNIFDKTLKAYDNNNLVKFLIKRLGPDQAKETIQMYYLGTSKHWEGATIFWQIDIKGRVRTGKVMLYDPENGKRIKKPYPHINWIHKIGNYNNYNLKQCLFGEHLLNLYPDKDIAIVESEKTALIASVYIPEFNWLASGNLNNLNKKTIDPLKGKLITLYPDAGAFHIWKKKADQLKDLADIRISDLIETRATQSQLKEGFDLADYLTESPIKFTRPEEPEQNKEEASNNISDSEKDERDTEDFFDELDHVNQEEPFNLWPIEELENYFNNTSLPEGPISLEGAITINDLDKYISTNLTTVKNNNGNPTFKPYFDRLVSLMQVLESF